MWDDLIDQDKPVTARQVNDVFYRCLVALPSNRFFSNYSSQLLPLIEAGILNWHGANQLEKVGSDHALQVAHVTRCSVGDVAVLSASLIHGHEYASSVAAELRMLMQQDSLEDYLRDLRAEQGGRNAHQNQV